jgi:hypothetical protein
MTIDILWLGGTGWGTGGDGISEEFRHQLRDRDPGERFRFVYVNYPADYGEKHTYDESLLIGRDRTLAAIKDSLNDVILGGYSQGADVAGMVACEIALGGHPDLTVLGCLLIADPWRPEGTSADAVIMGVAPGYGIRGQRSPDTNIMPTFWVANPGDPITALPAGNPLRTIADISEFMAVAPNPVTRGNELFTKVLKAVVDGRLQRWWSWNNWRTWGGALAFARGYILDGRHTTDYIKNGLCEALAMCVVNHSWQE